MFAIVKFLTHGSRNDVMHVSLGIKPAFRFSVVAHKLIKEVVLLFLLVCINDHYLK